jgi:hypothetical protein
LQQSYAELQKEGAEVLAVNLGEDADTVAAFSVDAGLSMPVLRDEGSSCLSLYGVQAIPVTFGIRLDGKIGWVKVGYSPDETTASLVAAARELKSAGPGPVDRIVVTPAGAQSVASGGTLTFTAAAYDANNVLIPATAFTWGRTGATDGATGSVTARGVFTAGRAGTIQVTATVGATTASSGTIIIRAVSGTAMPSVRSEINLASVAQGGNVDLELKGSDSGLLAMVSVPSGAVDPAVAAATPLAVRVAQLDPATLCDAKTGELRGAATGMLAAGQRFFQVTVSRTDNQAIIATFRQPLKLTFTVPTLSVDAAEDRAQFNDVLVSRYDEKLEVWQPLATGRHYESRAVWCYVTETSVFAPMVRRDLPKLDDIVGLADEGAILKLVGLKVISGYGQGKFGPEDLVTREQFAKMILLAAGIAPEPDAPLTFADKPLISQWAWSYVATAVKHRLILGVGENRFDPKGLVTRAQSLTMIGRFLGATDEGGTTAFADDIAIPAWARSEVKFTQDRAVVSTADFTNLEPAKPATRALCARFLARLVERRVGR